MYDADPPRIFPDIAVGVIISSNAIVPKTKISLFLLMIVLFFLVFLMRQTTTKTRLKQ